MRGLVPAWRGLRLAVAVNLRSKLKFALLTILIAISTLVFLAVTELSRASTSTLDEAINSDLGAAGTYRVEPAPDLGLSQSDLLSALRQVAAEFTDRPIQVAMRIPSVRPECPPFEQLGDVNAAIFLDADGLPVPFRGRGLEAATGDLCLAGLVVPRTDVRECSKSENANFDCSIAVDPRYAQLLRLSSAQPPQYVALVTTGRSADESDVLKNALNQRFSDDAAKASVKLDNAFVVTKQDTGGSVRSASDGIRLVYRLIAWGVLIIGGIGVLVAELIVLRDRTWFFGLARAVGARRWSVAWLVLADIVIVLLAGLAVAVTVLIATSPMVTTFGRDAFQTDLLILRPSALPGLVLGLVLVLVLGGAYPAWRATLLDPLDVLEKR